jgi:two-component system chemotaxis response regulator CheY
MPLAVLLIDDSPAIRKMIRRVLDISGFPLGRCHEASNGGDALATLEQEPIDLILTDINMPGMDGETFVRQMRERPEWAGLPVVVISTDSTSLRRERLEQLGVQGYLAKPFTPERLRAELERVLGAKVGAEAASQLEGVISDDANDF